MRVYIGAPIDTANPDRPPRAQYEWLAGLVHKGLGPDVVIFNPFAAFADSGSVSALEDLSYFLEVNMNALHAADIGVFIWNGSPSIGVPLEIEACSQSGKPVVVLNTSGKKFGVYGSILVSGPLGIVVEDEGKLLEALWSFKAGVGLRGKGAVEKA